MLSCHCHVVPGAGIQSARTVDCLEKFAGVADGANETDLPPQPHAITVAKRIARIVENLCLTTYLQLSGFFT